MGEDRAGRRTGEVGAGYEGWLGKQPLSENTKRSLEWLEATPA